MGLDMYLYRANLNAMPYIGRDYEQIKDGEPELHAKLKPYEHEHGTHFRWTDYLEDVGYWRKANAIHRWMVDNVQNGEDDCGYYEVSKNKLMELKDICEKVLAASELVDGKIYNGYTITNAGRVENYEDGKVVENSEVAEDLLPTCDGFFFGGTNYDEYYYADIKDTLEIIDKALNTDFNKDAIVYTSSW